MCKNSYIFSSTLYTIHFFLVLYLYVKIQGLNTYINLPLYYAIITNSDGHTKGLKIFQKFSWYRIRNVNVYINI